MVELEAARTAWLSDAQIKAWQLFREIVTRDLLVGQRALRNFQVLAQANRSGRSKHARTL